MQRFFSLRSKLIVYTLTLIILSMVSVGIFSDRYLHNYFERNAKAQLKENFFDLAQRLKDIELKLFDALGHVASDDRLVASMNLIKNYQDIEEYDAILFDEEKKRIVQLLQKGGQFSSAEHIIVYDHNYQLVAFLDQEIGASSFGYVSYENGKPVMIGKERYAKSYRKGFKSSHINLSMQPVKRLGGVGIQSGEVIYDLFEDKLKMTTSRTIVREVGYQKYNVVGYIESSHIIDRNEFGTLLDKSDVTMDYFWDRKLIEKTDTLIGRMNLDSSPLLFSSFSANELELAEDSKRFMSVARIALQEGVMYFTSEIAKDDLTEALETSRKLLFGMLITIVIIAVLGSFFVLKSLVVEPLGRLLEGIKVIGLGNYDHKIEIKSTDELGLISSQFNHMATKIMKREQELDELAHHDVLTKLPNRIMFIEQLNAAISRAKRLKTKLAVLFVDLDEFKSVNDTLGHNVGDELLINVAAVFTQTLRENDLIARIGGDEFNILIEDLESPVMAEEVAQKLIDSMNETFFIQDEQMGITCSIGVAIYPDDGEDNVTLMKNSDLAMYEAKTSGRNRYHFFSSELERQLKDRTIMLKELRGALGKGEFEIYYQPKFELKEGKIISAEALLRWKNPKLGFIRPDQFIPLAEESGEIVAIGEWVMEQACIDFMKWKEMGLPIKQISVNVSNIQFAQDDVIQVIENVIEKTGMPPGGLEVEMTESYIHENSASALRVLHQIRKLDVDLAIDDFGTGYSSMSYLKRLPLSRLKIDKSFINDIPYDEDDVEITKIIIALAKVMNLSITAEGVETLEQMHFLKELQCDEGQGYLCSKPLPFDQFVSMLEKHISCTVYE